jgi:hypothetical protein
VEDTSKLNDLPPVTGTYVISDWLITFEPRYPLRAGATYRADFDPNALAVLLAKSFPSAAEILPKQKLSRTIERPAPPPSPPANVAAIFPSTDTLPENQLKFYIHFSAPMSRGEAYQHVRLEKANGEEVPIPFLELSEELWENNNQRFTLFFEPGRVKRGVMLRDEIGPALVAGQEYALVVDGDWRDANGQPLGDDFRKKFRAGRQDETQPDPHQWKIASPMVGGRGPLVIEFEEPLDHEMLHRVIHVIDPQGDEKSGEIAVDQNETRWQFTPHEHWLPGNYELAIEGILEDLAGNSLGRKFEVRMEHRDREVVKEVRIPFQVAP